MGAVLWSMVLHAVLSAAQPLQPYNIAIDFFRNTPTCDGFSTLIVSVDCFSKIMHLVPLGEKTEATDIAAAFFQSMVKIHGRPSTIVSDHEPHF